MLKIKESIYNKLYFLFPSYHRLKAEISQEDVVVACQRDVKFIIFASRLAKMVIVVEPVNYFKVGVMAKKLCLNNVRVLSYALWNSSCKRELVNIPFGYYSGDIEEDTKANTLIDCIALDNIIDILSLPRPTKIRWLGGINAKKGAKKTLKKAEVIE